jgi:5-(carboxyamino)imidazole ribonucleotide mutase
MKVTIVMGSFSDKDKMKPAAEYLKKMGVSYTQHVASAHRTPDLVEEITNDSETTVFIAGAGMAAALPGCIAALTTKPVIGVPLSSKYGLMDSMLSILQMPPGIPVLTVGLDAAKNAAIAACEILSVYDNELAEKLQKERNEAAEKVRNDNEQISAE